MIQLTEAAVFRIKEMMKEEGKETFLRFGVKGGGCSGLSYAMHFDDQQSEQDTLYEFNGIQVLINKSDVPIVKETVIDYKQNLMGGGFTIENPNAIASCGCGSSFRTKSNNGTPEDC